MCSGLELNICGYELRFDKISLDKKGSVSIDKFNEAQRTWGLAKQLLYIELW